MLLNNKFLVNYTKPKSNFFNWVIFYVDLHKEIQPVSPISFLLLLHNIYNIYV